MSRTVQKTITSNPYDDNGELEVEYTVTFHGDDLRGDMPQLLVTTNQLTNQTQALHAIQIATSTTTEGNQPSGLFDTHFDAHILALSPPPRALPP